MHSLQLQSFGLDNAFATFVKLFRSFLFDLSVSLRLLKAADRVLDTTSRVVFDGGGVSDLPTSAACACDIDGGGADDKRGNIEALNLELLQFGIALLLPPTIPL